MNTVAARFARPRAAVVASRVYAALPLLTIFVWLCLIYGWEAWGNLSPWLFGDELEKTQLARAIAEIGHAARRGVPVTSHSLVAWLTAPAWLVHDTTRAYGLLKAIQVAVMTSVIFPTYFLARMLVSRNAALFAAAAAATIPALAYGPMIIAEPLAYPYAALCFFLIAKALVVRGRAWSRLSPLRPCAASWLLSRRRSSSLRSSSYGRVSARDAGAAAGTPGTGPAGSRCWPAP